ncbi:L-glutamate gamma-semialdehyde dehydrogenase, partial [Paenibacillus naphthalenovorans]
MVEPFRNEPFTDFSQSGNREAFAAALKKVQAQLGQEYGPLIGGEKLITARKAVSVNPADPTQVIGTVSQADTALADR